MAASYRPEATSHRVRVQLREQRLRGRNHSLNPIPLPLDRRPTASEHSERQPPRDLDLLKAPGPQPRPRLAQRMKSPTTIRIPHHDWCCRFLRPGQPDRHCCRCLTTKLARRLKWLRLLLAHMDCPATNRMCHCFPPIPLPLLLYFENNSRLNLLSD